MKRIMLELDADVARWLRKPGETPAPGSSAAELQRLVADLCLRLQPLHPGATDARLASQFAADLADSPSIDAALDRLRQSKAVRAAYVKPADEAPGG